MARRLMVPLAVSAAALAAAVPSQAATTYTLIGHGWGHGIGLSQWGAYGYASHGWTYRRILAHYYTGTAIDQSPLGFTERVAMMDGRQTVHFGASAKMDVIAEGDGTTASLPAGSYRIEAGVTAGYQRVWNTTSTSIVLSGLAAPVQVIPSTAPLLLVEPSYRGFGNDHWHGQLRFLLSGGNVRPVNVVSLDNYARGIVPCEESPSWPIEALKAQAVAARSYAYRTRNTDQSISAIDTKADVANQTYCPIEREGTASASAVAATSREIVTYQGSVAATFYSASSGGRTSSMQASWGSSFGYPYLVPVTDRYDGAGGANPNHTWKPVVYGPIELARKFGLNGSVFAVDQTIDLPSQRVTSLVIHRKGFAPLRRTSGQAFSALGLRSTYFRLLGVTLTPPASVIKARNFTITGRVWPRPTTKVLLQFHADGVSGWTTAGTPLKIAASGTFSVVRHQSVPHSFRVVRNAAVSPVVRVGIHAAKMVPPSSLLQSWA
ncbi:MAG: SpoIID/LytB domain-containing protein [Gaiellales bacterium]